MINLYNTDCMAFMADKPDNSYDLAIVDPPYGIGDFVSSKSKHKYPKVEWNNKIPDKVYFDELLRISKNQIVWGANYYGDLLPNKGRIIWDKTGGGKRNFPVELSTCDLASHSFGVNMKIFHHLYVGNIDGSKTNWGKTHRIHPCQKPVALYKWIIQHYAQKGDKILDTHGGSMSIAIACHDMGFDLDLCELDKDYFEAGKKRYENHISQLRMF